MHVLDYELEMYIMERLPRSQQSEISFHLGTCSACQNKLADAAKVAGLVSKAGGDDDTAWKDRRRFVRVPADEPASLRVLNPVSFARSPARVLDMSPEGLKLRVSEFLHPGSTIQIRLADTIAFGEVRYCKPAGSAFHVGVQLQDSFPAHFDGPQVPKRAAPRHSLSTSGNMRIKGVPEPHSITILDVSRSGLRIRCRTSVPVGTRVEVTWGDALVSGAIRYAREVVEDEFHMGINVDGVSREGLVDEREVDLTLLFKWG
jgi:hypothetical protein